LGVLGPQNAARHPQLIDTANFKEYEFITANLLALDHRVCLIAGIQSGDGATITLCRLGRSLAERGKKTLLIEANDSHNLSFSRIFSVQNEHGLIDLFKSDSPSKKIVQSTRYVNLHILTIGDLKHISLIKDSTKLVSILEELKKEFDVILIDAGALATSADVVFLSRIADAAFLVVSPERYDKQHVANSVMVFESSGSNLGGIILNRF
jgi:protein-tyrosine kinase